MVMVLEGSDRLAIALARGLLEEAGIPFYVSGEEIGARPGMADPFIHPWCRVLVPRDRETDARALLQRFGAIPDAL